MQTPSTREVGDTTEHTIDLWFSKFGIHGFTKTKGSGAVHGDGDRTHGEFMREDKHKGSAAFTISAAEFHRAKKQALRQGLKLLFCVENRKGEAVVVMPIEHFLPLLGSYLDTNTDEED